MCTFTTLYATLAPHQASSLNESITEWPEGPFHIASIKNTRKAIQYLCIGIVTGVTNQHGSWVGLSQVWFRVAIFYLM